MNRKICLLSFILATMIIACRPERSPIDYGLDKCYYCKMTIVDQRFGAELVTTKGKVYKFDATECLIHFNKTREVPADEMAMLLTNTFDRPGELVDVNQCFFLQSENMPSPMGKFINPFSSKDMARKIGESESGTLFQWNELIERLVQLH
jgi:copper chaperone NosL